MPITLDEVRHHAGRSSARRTPRPTGTDRGRAACLPNRARCPAGALSRFASRGC